MTRGRWRSLVALAVALGTAPAAPAGVDEPPSIAWEPLAGPTVAVRVCDLPLATRRAMATAGEDDPRWPAVLAVRVVAADGTTPLDRPPIGGKYRLDGRTLRFRPLFPLDAGRRYRATFDPDGALGAAPTLTADRPATPRPATTPTVVVRVEPTGDRLPENLLKFYLHFSAPMGRGAAYDHLQLVAGDGKPLDHPFLELGEELWDPTATRLTVLLDPGRIKRGLRPREELGPILVAGRTYTLRVDPAWRDAAGQPLAAPAAKTFAATPAAEASPDPQAWKVASPGAGTGDPLAVRFAGPLDRATVASGLTLLDAAGAEVQGTATADLDGRGWSLVPARPWLAGAYTLTVNPDLEDLAGNSIRRPFEVDVQRDVPVVPDTAPVRLPIAIGP